MATAVAAAAAYRRQLGSASGNPRPRAATVQRSRSRSRSLRRSRRRSPRSRDLGRRRVWPAGSVTRWAPPRRGPRRRLRAGRSQAIRHAATFGASKTTAHSRRSSALRSSRTSAGACRGRRARSKSARTIAARRYAPPRLGLAVEALLLKASENDRPTRAQRAPALEHAAQPQNRLLAEHMRCSLGKRSHSGAKTAGACSGTGNPGRLSHSRNVASLMPLPQARSPMLRRDNDAIGRGSLHRR
jgi:hypothetical protein